VSTPGNTSHSVSMSNVNSGGLRGPKKFLHVVAGMGGSKSTTDTPAKNVSPPPSPSIVQVQSGMIMSVGRSSHDSRRSPAAQDAGVGIGLGRPSLEIRRGDSYSVKRRQASPSELLLTNRSSTSPEEHTMTTTTPNADSSPSPSPCEEPRYHHRPSMDSNNIGNARPSLDGSRPNSNRLLVDDEDRTQRQTPLLKILDSSGEGSRFGGGGGVSPVPRSSVGAQARSRKRSMSVQEKMGGRSGRLLFPGGAGAGASVLPRPGSSLSVGRGSRGGYAYGEGNESNGGGGGVPKPEWLGPRTAKAFRAAGLLDHHDREKGGSGPGSVLSKEREREASLSGNGNDVLDRLRERSGSGSVVSANGVLAPSPLGNGVGGGSSAIHRFASLRASSEYNRSHSRMTFSDVGGPVGPTTISRRGSESISAYGGGGNACGLMESPTFSYSGSSGSRGERDRDTPRSATTSSTALTSLSESFGYFGREREREKDRDRDRDREWEDIRELKEKHSTEVAALLSALSDSQRTVRMLREENSGLRERLDRVVVGEVSHSRENEELKRAYEGLQLEFEGLRRECGRLKRRRSISVRAPAPAPVPAGIAPSWSGSSASASSGLRTPKPVNSSPLATDVTSRFFHQDEYNDTVVIHDSIDDDEHEPFRRRRAFLDTDVDVDDDKVVVDDDDDEDPLNAIPPTSESTPLIHRRLSNSSSIFPVPPPNMTMLLDVDDDNEGSLPPVANSNRSSAHYRLSLPMMEDSPRASSVAIPIPKSKKSYLHSGSPPPVTFKNFTGSVVSEHNMSVSPTTADFSIVTGGGGSSPRSLFLRPEHELLLGDMESLDLGGVVPPIELHSSELRDDW
jgi:hypothetical protein